MTTVSGGTLSGSGTLGGLVANGGTVRPGNPTASLSVAGAVTLSANSTYLVDVNAAGQSSRIVANGKASLDGGTVEVALPASIPAHSTTYTILTADGGLNGTFADVTSNSRLLIPNLSYNANDVFLTLKRTPFSANEDTPNQRAVANALDQSPLTSALVSTIGSLDSTERRRAFDAISGEIYGTTASVILDDSRYLRFAIFDRFSQPANTLDAGSSVERDSRLVSTAGDTDSSWWTQGLGAWGKIDHTGNSASVSRNLAGFIAGVDRSLGESWRAGVAGVYSNSSASVNGRLSYSNINSVHIAGYTGTIYGPWSFLAGGTFGWNSFGVSRFIQFPDFSESAAGHNNGATEQAFGEVGYRSVIDKVTAEPFATMSFVHLKNGSFNETGGTAALVGADTMNDIGYSTLGLRATTEDLLQSDTLTLTPRASVSWQHAIGKIIPAAALKFQTTGSNFTVLGAPLQRDLALIAMSFDLRIMAHATFGISVAGAFGSGATDHSVNGDFTWQF